jgi:lysophospholipase L1-like esterase
MPGASDLTSELSQKGLAHFRRLTRAVALVSVVTLAIASGISYVIYLQKEAEAAAGQDIYAGIKQAATLTYYLVWLSVALLAFAATFQKRYPLLPFYILLAFLAEAAAFAFYFTLHLHIYQPVPRVLFERFETHPLLIVQPRVGNFGFGISHDGEHRRTTINEGKAAQAKRIFVFGGSTTYDTGNTDGNTWPSRLSALLGENFAVENLGIPAYSSLENLIQSLFVFRDQPPACAIYYEGWNDLRNSHVKDLRNDYSDLELPHIADFLQPARRRSFLETYSVFFGLLGTVLDPQPRLPRFSGKVNDQQDLRLSRIYQDNIKLIATVGRQFGVRVIFIPQALNYAQLTSEYVGDLPFIKQKDTKKLMILMNEDLAHAAGESGADFIGAPLSVAWTNGDFVDDGHFNAAGAQKFAQSIVEDVRRMCQ